MQSSPPPQQDDFVTAVLLTFDPTLPAGGMKAAAQQYCDSIRSSPDGWRLCLQKLHELAVAKGSDQVKFWCLTTLQQVAESRYPLMSEEEKTVLRRSLMLYVRDVIPVAVQSAFLKNKLCSIFVHIVKHDYPTHWPSFFSDFLSLLEKGGVEVIDVFVRLLKILDEEVVEATTDGQSLPQEHRHNTAIKDSMRERDLAAIVDAMYSICQLYHASHPGLVAAALEAFSEYIKWIDINLVVSQRFLTMLYGFMNPDPNAAAAAAVSNGDGSTSPKLGGSVSDRIHLQLYATDCIIEIIEKRMDGAKKIQLLQQLRILDFINTALVPTQLSMILPHQANSPQVQMEAAKRYAEKPQANNSPPPEKFAETIASLIESIGSELIESMEKLVKAAGGANAAAAAASGSNPQAAQNLALVSEALPMLDAALSLGYRFFEHPLYTVAEETLEMYAEYLSLIKKAGPWSSGAPPHARRIFESLSKAMSYPPWYHHSRGDDEDELFDEFRSACLKLFVNLAYVNPQLVVELMGGRIKDTLQNLQSLPHATVEVTLKLFYQLAEPLRCHQRPSEEPYRSMIGSLLSSSISSYPHPQVSLLYFDLVVRYVKFLDGNPEFVGPVLASFLDHRGIRHASARVRGRACYLFFKCVSAFPDGVKKQMAPFVDDMLKEIQTVMETVMGTQDTAPAASAAAPGATPTSGAGKDGALVSFEDALHLCESMGILCSSQVTGTANVHRYVQLVFHFFRSQLETAVAPANVPRWYPHDQERVSLRLSQLIECVSVISKPLSHDGGRIADLMLDMAQIILQVLTTVPHQLPVVLKTIFFAHRMIDCFPSAHATNSNATATTSPATAAQPPSPASPTTTSLLQFFGLALQLLLKHATPASIVKIIDLLNQLILKFKKKFEPVLDSIFLTTCEKVFEALATYAHVDQPQLAPTDGKANGLSAVPLPSAAYSTEKQERLLLQQRYFEFLKCMLTCDLMSVFSSSTNAPHIKSVLDTILAGMISPADFAVHRVCFQLLKHIVSGWQASGVIGADPAIRAFVQRDATNQMFKSVVASHFNLGDPNAISAVREWLELQKTIYAALGEEYLNFLHAEFLPVALHFPPDVAKEYCVTLLNYAKLTQHTGSEWKQFEPFLKMMRANSNSNTPNANRQFFPSQ